MKKMLVCGVAAALIGYGAMSFASGTKKLQPVAEEEAKAAIQQSIGKIQLSFSGLVRKTDSGLMLETTNGKYQLKGLSLEEIVGKQVYVTGVVKSDDEMDTIYVVQADVKE